MKWSSCAWLVFAAGMPGCAPTSKSPPTPTLEMALAVGVPLGTLRRGHGAYLTQCGGCHELIPPDNVETADWKLVMPGMCWNAGLSQADEKLVLKYVLAAKQK